MAAVRDRAGGGPGLFEKIDWFGHSSRNAETAQSPKCGQGCEEQVHPGEEGWMGHVQDMQARFLHPSILGAV